MSNSGPSTPRTRRHIQFQTPRVHKAPNASKQEGLKHLKETPLDIKHRVKKKLGLSFDLEDWQAHVIHRLRQGYDSILVAGTGYGKSIVFEGLAALEKAKMLIVISPLKALERDQVSEARKKGLRAEMLNENTACPELWSRLEQGRDQLYYISPEMALSDHFISLWQKQEFRDRVQALVVDEAHCIAEWGDEFRPAYKELAQLRRICTQEIPFFACTATCPTETFDVIWEALTFGYRPFWGLDVGCERTNLSYLVRTLENIKNPVLDLLNMLPDTIAHDAPATILPKSILYFETVEACNQAVETLRKCLPAHLRDYVQTFKSTTSEVHKEECWEKFREGAIRVLCATDAAGMGCNVPDVEIVALFKVPRTLSVLSQRWGRGGRSRSTDATCLLFVPKWVFRPPENTTGKKKESKADAERRANLEKPLEGFVNSCCFHSFFSTYFRPQTGLNTYHNLHQDPSEPDSRGPRSSAAAVELSWTVLSLRPGAPKTRCCSQCTPAILSPFAAPNRHDPRLTAYIKDFIFGVPGMLPPANSSAMVASGDGQTQSSSSLPLFAPTQRKVELPDTEQKCLTQLLDDWRRSQWTTHTPKPALMSRRALLPDSHIAQIVEHGGDFLRVQIPTINLLKSFLRWDLASPADWEGVLGVIVRWRQDVEVPRTPPSRQHARKKTRKHQDDPAPMDKPIQQPDFQTTAHIHQGAVKANTRQRSRRGAGPHNDDNGKLNGPSTSLDDADADFFASPRVRPPDATTRSSAPLPSAPPPSMPPPSAPPLSVSPPTQQTSTHNVRSSSSTSESSTRTVSFASLYPNYMYYPYGYGAPSYYYYPPNVPPPQHHPPTSS